MKDEGRTKQELLKEVSVLRKELAALKKAPTKPLTEGICFYSHHKSGTEAENRYPCFFDNTGTAMLIIDEDTTVLLINKECEKLTGFMKENVEGKKSWTEFVVVEELERLRNYHYLRRTNPDLVPRTYQTRIIDNNGNVKDVFVTSAMISGTKRSIASLFDITEQKTLERQLMKSERTFRALVEQLPATIVYIAAIDERSTTLYVSPQILDILGYTPDEYMENPDIWFQCLHPDDKARVLDQLAQCHKTGEPFTAEYRMIRKDSRMIWFHDEAHVIKGENGVPLFLLGVNTDITERKTNEMELAERGKELLSKTQKLEEVNIALRVILEKREKDKSDLQENTLLNFRQLIEPFIEKLKGSGLNAQQTALLEIVESNLKETCSSFVLDYSSAAVNLTPTEIRIANLIKNGKTTKEICGLLNVSEKAVAFHRGNIRRKLGLESRKMNLKSHLLAKTL